MKNNENIQLNDIEQGANELFVLYGTYCALRDLFESEEEDIRADAITACEVAIEDATFEGTIEAFEGIIEQIDALLENRRISAMMFNNAIAEMLMTMTEMAISAPVEISSVCEKHLNEED